MTAALTSSAFDDETVDVWLVLLRLDHDDLAQPILVVNNNEDITSGSDTYTAFPFDIQLPDDVEDSPPRARLQIDNVSREIAQSIRLLTGPMSVLIEVVLASDPDVIERSWPDFILTDVKWDALKVSGDLSLENFVNEPYPAGSFTPGAFPGIF